MSKKVKCCECDSFMGWALPRGVDKDNYEYAKEVLKLRKLYKGCIGESKYAKYKTKRG